MEYMPRVIQAVATDDYKVYAYFDDGKITCIDMSKKLEKGIFQQLKNIQLFKDTLTVMNETVAWDINGNNDPSECIDIDPESIYKCPEVKESYYIDNIA